MVKRRQQLVGDTSMKFGRSNPKRFLTIHETGNTSVGANAAAHANLQSRRWEWATWHWTVDASEAVQSYTHDYQLWHAGDGRGNGNLSSIGIEICINTDMSQAVSRRNAAELAAHILVTEGIPLGSMVQHNYWSGKNCPSVIRGEGHWNEFVKMVRDNMGGKKPSTSKPKPKPSTGGKSVAALANEVQAGKHGNGEARKQSLGSQFNAVQAEVNRRLYGGSGGGNPGNTNTSVESMAQAVIRGDYGVGDDRRRRLGNNYAAVQARVNQLLGITVAAPAPSKKPSVNIDAMARASIRGDYGNGADRQRRLGANYAAVQHRVNQILGLA